MTVSRISMLLVALVALALAATGAQAAGTDWSATLDSTVASPPSVTFSSLGGTTQTVLIPSAYAGINTGRIVFSGLSAGATITTAAAAGNLDQMSNTGLSFPALQSTNTFYVEVTDQDGVTKQLYQIDVKVVSSLVTFTATLTDSSVSSPSIPSITDAGGDTQQRNVPAVYAGSATGVITFSDLNGATITQTGTVKTNGATFSYAALGSTTPLTVELLAEDGITKKTYTINVFSATSTTDWSAVLDSTAASGQNEVLFTSAGGSAGSQDVMLPSVYDGITTGRIVISGLPAGATITTAVATGNLDKATNAPLTFPALGNSLVFYLEVTAQDGITKQTYDIEVETANSLVTFSATVSDTDRSVANVDFTSAGGDTQTVIVGAAFAGTTTGEISFTNLNDGSISATGGQSLTMADNKPLTFGAVGSLTTFTVKVVAEDMIAEKVYTIKIYVASSTITWTGTVTSGGAGTAAAIMASDDAGATSKHFKVPSAWAGRTDGSLAFSSLGSTIMTTDGEIKTNPWAVANAFASAGSTTTYWSVEFMAEDGVTSETYYIYFDTLDNDVSWSSYFYKVAGDEYISSSQLYSSYSDVNGVQTVYFTFDVDLAGVAAYIDFSSFGNGQTFSQDPSYNVKMDKATFTFPATANDVTTLTFMLMAEDTSVMQAYTINVRFGSAADVGFTGQVSSTVGVGASIGTWYESSGTMGTYTMAVGAQYAGQAGSITITTDDAAATFGQTGGANTIKSSNAFPVTFPAMGMSATYTFTINNGVNSFTYNVILQVPQSHTTGFTGSVSSTSVGGDPVTFDEDDFDGNTLVLTVPMTYAGKADGSMMLTGVDGATFTTAGTIKTNPYTPITFAAVTATTNPSMTFQITAQDGTTTQMYTISFRTAGSTTTDWSASLTSATVGGAPIVFTSADADSFFDLTVKLPVAWASVADGVVVFSGYAPATITNAGDWDSDTETGVTFAVVGSTMTYDIEFQAQETSTTRRYDITFRTAAQTTGFTASVSSGGAGSVSSFTDAAFTNFALVVNVPRTWASRTDGALTITGANFAAFSSGGSITANPYTPFTFAAAGQTTSTMTFEITADGGNKQLYTISFRTTPSSLTDWSASINSNPVVTFSSAGGISQTVHVARANSEMAGAIITFSNIAPGASLVTSGGQDINSNPSAPFTFPLAGAANKASITVKFEAEDGSFETYTIILQVDQSSATAWTATLSPNPVITFTSTMGSGNSQTVHLPRVQTNQYVGITFTAMTGTIAGTGADFTQATGQGFTAPTAPGGAGDITKTVKFVAEDGSETVYTIIFEVDLSTDKSWSAVLSTATAPTLGSFSSGGSATQSLTIPGSYAGQQATFTFTLPKNPLNNQDLSSFDSSKTITQRVTNFNLGAVSSTTSYTVRVLAEDGSSMSANGFTFSITIAGSSDARWNATVTIGSWVSPMIMSTSAASPKIVSIPFAQRALQGFFTVWMASGATLSGSATNQITTSPFIFAASPAGGSTADYPIKVIAEDTTTNSISTIRLSTATNPSGTSTGSNGGLTDGTDFNLTITATAPGGVAVKVVVFSDDFDTNAVTVNLPAAAAGVNATLWFQFLGGYNARLTTGGGATIVNNPKTVMLPAAGAFSTYSIRVTNDRGDNNDYTVKVMVAAAGCVGAECAASTLMQLSLPLAILLFLFGRRAAQQ